MKILATNNFNNKLNQFTELSVKNKLLSLIEQIESSGNISHFVGDSQLSVDNVYVYKIQDYRLFYTVENDDIIFVDIIKKESQKIRISSKNPKTNSSINPKYNTSINPKYNSSINPKYNSSINPKYNSSINPKYNSSINPKYNSSINPKYNASINPKRNTSINPKMNPSFNGLYLFDLDGNSDYFIVNANENVILIYDNNNEIQSFGVKRSNGFSVYDFNNQQYQSFLTSDGQDGYNQFDLNGLWIGYAK
jgi:mRNA-degrading endonuclease RelE of RelBE toxin-antitoxin system